MTLTMNSVFMTVNLNVNRTALGLIDTQNWIVGRSLAPHPATKVIQNAVTLSTAIRKAGGLVALVRVEFSAGYLSLSGEVLRPDGRLCRRTRRIQELRTR